MVSGSDVEGRVGETLGLSREAKLTKTGFVGHDFKPSFLDLDCPGRSQAEPNSLLWRNAELLRASCRLFWQSCFLRGADLPNLAM